MKLRTPPTGGPRRTPFGASGSELASTARSLSRPAGLSTSPVMSLTWADRSRTAPWASTRPGFSAPGAPNLTSFIGGDPPDLCWRLAGSCGGRTYPVALSDALSQEVQSIDAREHRQTTEQPATAHMADDRSRRSIGGECAKPVDKWWMLLASQFTAGIHLPKIRCPVVKLSLQNRWTTRNTPAPRKGAMAHANAMITKVLSNTTQPRNRTLDQASQPPLSFA